MKGPSTIAVVALAAATVVGGSVGSAAALAADPSPTSLATTPAPTATLAAGTIVFARADVKDGPTTLYTIHPGGSGLHAAEAGFMCCDQWSFDGTHIQFAANAPDGKRMTTAVIDAYGSNRTLVPLPDASLNLIGGAWTPDGRIVFEGWDDHDTARNGLYIADPTNISTLKRLTTTSGGDHDVPTVVSPDGSRVLFIRAAADPANPGNLLEGGHQYTIGLDGTGLQQLTPNGWSVSIDTEWGNTATWSPDGKQVTFVATGDGGGTQANLYTVDATGGAPTPIARGIMSWETPQWSPDGKWIAFDGDAADANGVVVIRPDGTGRTPLVPTKAADGTPVDPGRTCCAVWSPDGSRLLFQVTTKSDLVDLFTMNADGSDLVRLTDEPGWYTWYSWGP